MPLIVKAGSPLAQEQKESASAGGDGCKSATDQPALQAEGGPEEGAEVEAAPQGHSAPEEQQPAHANVSSASPSQNIVQHLSSDAFTVDAEYLDGAGTHGQTTGELWKAQATPPCEFSATLSQSFKPGEPFMVQGPLGPIRVEPPPEAQPGMSLLYRLAPRPDFRVQVPPGARPGSQMKFVRSDGVEVIVQVPAGVSPGDSFDVTPPALMVKVPEGAGPGAYMIFKNPCDSEESEWYRVRVPEGAQPGNFLTARLPAPKQPRPGASTGQGWGAALRAHASELKKELRGPLQMLRSLGQATFERSPLPEGQQQLHQQLPLQQQLQQQQLQLQQQQQLLLQQEQLLQQQRLQLQQLQGQQQQEPPESTPAAAVSATGEGDGTAPGPL